MLFCRASRGISETSHIAGFEVVDTQGVCPQFTLTVFHVDLFGVFVVFPQGQHSCQDSPGF